MISDPKVALSAQVKPVFRWAGSKRKLLARLRPYWRPGQHKRYVEPFAGSACLFFDLQPRSAILGDANGELIDAYKEIQQNPGALFNRLLRIRRDPDTYYRWRKKSVVESDSSKRALKFLYLNRNCFNGIYRTNAKGQFNVPFGGKNGKPPGALTRKEFLGAAEQLKYARLLKGDFSKTLGHAKKGDFVYLDPPFAVSSRRLFTEYGQTPFATSDVSRLAEELRRLDSLGVDFLVSYADCAEARILARDWHAEKLYVRRHIAGFSDHRRNASEWLISNCMPNN